MEPKPPNFRIFAFKSTGFAVGLPINSRPRAMMRQTTASILLEFFALLGFAFPEESRKNSTVESACVVKSHP